jgi:hypothetical protein
MCCEISELFTTADVCVPRYLIFSLQQKYLLRDIKDVHYSRLRCCEISKLFTQADVCVARY